METMYQARLADLRKPRGYPAVSVLMPTHRQLPPREQDPIRLRNLLGQARRRLSADPAVSGARAAAVMERLERVASEVDLVYASDGLALFASESDASAHLIDHQVAERVEVAETYATRDLVADAVRAQRYWALALSEKPTRLWAGANDHVTEVIGDGFPMTREFADEEAALPAGFGKDRGTLRDERRRQHFREVDAALAQIRAHDPRPLIVLGVERDLAVFDQVSQQLDAVIGRVRGGFGRAGEARIAESVAPVLRDELRRRQQRALAELTRARGANRYAAGLGEVWELARQGRGSLLLVEQGYREHAAEEFASGAPPAVVAPVVDDAVDEVVETILDGDGDVVFVPDGALAEQDRIALALRY